VTALIKPEERQRKRARGGGITAQIARAALANLMSQGLPPTPDNYSRAWREACDAALVRDPPVRPSGPKNEPAPASAGGDGELPDEVQLAPALAAAAQPGAPSAEVHEAERRSGELIRLVHTLCDVLGSFSDDESWVSGQIQAVRRLVQGDIDRAALADLRVLLGDTARRQKTVREQRQRTVDHLKSSLVEIAGLSRSTDSFADRMAERAAGIEGAPSLEALGDLVKGLLDDTRSMQVSVEESRQGIERSSETAADLEKELARLEEQLATVSAEMLTDHLTRTMNRRGLDESFLSCHAEALAQGSALSVALIDVDDFKRLNDALGHQAGDEALRHVADLLKTKLRPTDVVARYGGEEFVMVLPGAERDAAVKTIERLQRALTEHVFVHGANRTFITFSGGVTQVRLEDSLQTALKRADHAMYVAKRAGKNCVRKA
jgi:diguanylate cyclase